MNLSILARILSPSLLLILINVFLKIGIEYYPLSFSLVLIIFNWKKNKGGMFFGLISIIILSYISFFIAYFSIYLLHEIFKLFQFQTYSGIVSIAVSSFIIAPILVFFSFKFIFNYSNTKITYRIILISLFFLIIVSCIFYYFNDNEIIKFLKNNKLDHYTFWQVIMALAIQFLTFQKSIWRKEKI